MQYMARTNTSMLFTQDTLHAISAFLQKKTPTFPKLWSLINVKLFIKLPHLNLNEFKKRIKKWNNLNK